jgi:hypothetical protein
MKWHIVIALGVLSATTELYANTWSCRNDVEIQCGDVSCTTTKSGEFTPMNIRFDTHGNFSVCAYTGCWDGKGRVITSSSLVVIQKERASWSVPNTTADMRENISIMFSTADRIALIKAGMFVLPMHCFKESKRAGWK